MKPIYLTYLAFGPLFLCASCSQEDVEDRVYTGGDNRILFHTSLPGVSTRSQEIVESTLSSFHVTAFNPNDPDLKDAVTGSLKEHIANVYLTREEGNDVISSELCSWPAPGKDGIMDFFAYYPAVVQEGATGCRLVNRSTMSGTTATIDYKLENFTVTRDIAGEIDFVTAHSTGSMEKNLFSGIKLDFQHQLSQINLKAWGANKTCNIEIAGIRIGGVAVKGNFNFVPKANATGTETAGTWDTNTLTKGVVEYIFREGKAQGEGDKIVILAGQGSTTATADNAVSIMGKGGAAMVIPASGTAWDYKNNPGNTSYTGMYFSVLVRITDNTSSGPGNQVYPASSDADGANIIALAVNSATGEITAPGRLYKGKSKYYTDAAKTNEYQAPTGTVVKEFGWAALPVADKWEAGFVYTYVLDYSNGVGVHDPEVIPEPGNPDSPKPGDPIISDHVGVSVGVSGWNSPNTSNPDDPHYHNPEIVVPED